PREKEWSASVRRGERLFTSTGCVVCHRDEKANGPKGAEVRSVHVLTPPEGTRFPLTGVRDKTTPGRLAAYLANPQAVDPIGRVAEPARVAGIGGGPGPGRLPVGRAGGVEGPRPAGGARQGTDGRRLQTRRVAGGRVGRVPAPVARRAVARPGPTAGHRQGLQQ